MSQENVDLVISLYDDVQQRDYESPLERLDENVLGDHVLVEVTQRNRGRGSGVAVDFHYFQLYRISEGKVTACYSAATREEALEAAGVKR